MNSTTLQQYLNTALADREQIDHVLRVVSCTDRGDGPSTEFYIRPQAGDGETLQLVVCGNRVMLPVQADQTLIDDFKHFLAYSNLSASAELLVAYSEGRGEAITMLDAIIAVDPLMQATHAGLAAHQQEQAHEGAQIATISVPPLDGRVPTENTARAAEIRDGAFIGRDHEEVSGRSAELRATDEYVPPAAGPGYALHTPDQQHRQLHSHQVNPANDVLTITVADKRAPDGGNRAYVVDGIKPHRNPANWKYPEGQTPFTLAESDNIELATHYKHLLEQEVPVRIVFQEGPINEVGVNGLTHEVLLAILIDRLEGFQDGPYANDFNGNALHHLREAQEQLLDRTRERMARGVEGTHTK